jgi:hypothetical protein
MAAYYVKYQGWKRTVEVIYHNKSDAEAKRDYLARHGVSCKMGRHEDK